MLGKKFRRQFSISHYIVDFFCIYCGIAIELDGAPHFRERRAEYEARRTAFLTGWGIEVIRFENRVVHDNIEAIGDDPESHRKAEFGLTSPRHAEAKVALHQLIGVAPLLRGGDKSLAKRQGSKPDLNASPVTAIRRTLFG